MKRFAMFFLMSIIIFFAAAVNAQWSNDPMVNTPICTAPYTQYLSQITNDGVGGAIITWVDLRGGDHSSNENIYASRVNANGTVPWTPDGVAICAAPNQQSTPKIISDGAGGAIIAWYDNRSYGGDLYAQRINATGNVQWTLDGVAICTAPGAQSYARMVSDGAGGAIISWSDLRGGLGYDIYAQRINAAGNVQWTLDGVAICTAMNDQILPQITSDGVGGAIIAWFDCRNGSINSDIYAQRINAAGNVQWTLDGVAICTAPNNQNQHQIMSDGVGGAIIAWGDYRNDSTLNYAHIYTQRINAGGAVQWTPDGVAICTAPGGQYGPRITTDGAGGAIIAYAFGFPYHVYAQRINAGGALQWTLDGVAISIAASDYNIIITNDVTGGAIIAWLDTRSFKNDIYAQRINAGGAVQWTLDGVAICTAANNQYSSGLVNDGTGGAIITWDDYRTGTSYDIYAQKMNADGTLGLTGSSFVYQFSSGWNMVSLPLLVTDNHKTTLFPTATSQAFAYLGSYIPKDTLSIGVGYWLKFDSYQQVAITGQVFTIDTIYTKEGWNMIGSSSEPIQASTIISDPPEVSISQFFGYDEIYVTSDTIHPGKGYWVKVSQDCKLIPTSADLDLAKTQTARVHIVPTSELPPLPPDKALFTSNIIPHEYALEQNYPNPFNPTTTIEFSLPQAGYVTLKVCNILGQEVATLVNEVKSPGIYTVNWAADNNTPGVYFCRLISKGQTKSIKMLLIK